ncbi:MAG: hypothetical protein NTW52_14845 [Planctomycetota bacterium]|nr:hypothetical protein [Planctomycetota bacterium]
MNAIRIEIPLSVDDLDFTDYLQSNWALYRQALNGRSKDHDPRSEVDTIRITEVHLDSNHAVIGYEVDFCIRNGCQDRVDSDTHCRQVIARRDGRCFVFQSDSPAETRSTDEEF